MLRISSWVHISTISKFWDFQTSLAGLPTEKSGHRVIGIPCHHTLFSFWILRSPRSQRTVHYAVDRGTGKGAGMGMEFLVMDREPITGKVNLWHHGDFSVSLASSVRPRVLLSVPSPLALNIPFHSIFFLLPFQTWQDLEYFHLSINHFCLWHQ